MAQILLHYCFYCQGKPVRNSRAIGNDQYEVFIECSQCQATGPRVKCSLYETNSQKVQDQVSKAWNKPYDDNAKLRSIIKSIHKFIKNNSPSIVPHISGGYSCCWLGTDKGKQVSLRADGTDYIDALQNAIQSKSIIRFDIEIGKTMSRKKSLVKPLTLVVIPTMLMLAGCQDSNVQRDVYQNKDECAADWGTDELCQEIPQDQVDEQSHHSTFANGYRIWGPTYYPGDRSVDYNGRTYSARSTSTSRPYISVSSSSRAATSSRGSPVSRGGFGGGHGFSFGG